MSNHPTGSITNPFALPDTEGYTWLKGNLHSHTTNSDGKVAPQDRLDGYINQGYDYLCLYDHHNITFTNTVKAPDDFVLIQGAELHPDNEYDLNPLASLSMHSRYRKIGEAT